MTVARNFTKGAETAQHGPSWYDVHTYMEDLKDRTRLPVSFTFTQVRSVSGMRGLYIRVLLGERLVEGIGEGYGKSHQNSAATFPAALHNLMYKLDDLRDGLTPLERAARWGETLDEL